METIFSHCNKFKLLMILILILILIVGCGKNEKNENNYKERLLHSFPDYEKEAFEKTLIKEINDNMYYFLSEPLHLYEEKVLEYITFEQISSYSTESVKQMITILFPSNGTEYIYSVMEICDHGKIRTELSKLSKDENVMNSLLSRSAKFAYEGSIIIPRGIKPDVKQNMDHKFLSFKEKNLNEPNEPVQWKDGNLVGINDGENVITYTYDDESYRTSKSVNGFTTYFIYENNHLLQESNDLYTVDYLYEYDERNDYYNPIGFVVDDITYKYLRNEANVIVGVLDDNNIQIVKYEYDEYSRLIQVLGINSNNEWINKSIDTNFIGNKNHILSEANYFDSETGWYYYYRSYFDTKNKVFIIDKSYNKNLQLVNQLEDILQDEFGSKVGSFNIFIKDFDENDLTTEVLIQDSESTDRFIIMKYNLCTGVFMYNETVNSNHFNTSNEKDELMKEYEYFNNKMSESSINTFLKYDNE